MAAPIPTTFSAVLSAIVAQLGTWPAVNLSDGSRIGLSLGEDVPHTTGDREILIRPENERKDPTGLGSGRVEGRVRRRVGIRLRTRMSLDEINRDTAWLQGAAVENGQSITLGHLAFEDAVIDALDLWQPVDGDQNALTFAPIVYEGLNMAHRFTKDSGYGHSDLFFDIPYIRILSQSF